MSSVNWSDVFSKIKIGSELVDGCDEVKRILFSASL
jgi:hypothetical protein